MWEDDGGCTTEEDALQTLRKGVDVASGKDRQSLMFCRNLIDDATHAHFAPDAGFLIRLAWAWGPSQMQSSRGTQDNPCTAAANCGDIRVPSSAMRSMDERRDFGCSGSKKRMLIR